MKKKILIVDDNSTNIYLLQSLLASEGWEVITAENGQVALDKAHADPPDMIISDILMPVMDGYTLCRQCKEDERLQTMPFVFYTATYTEPKDEKFALSLGADRFVLKPQEPDVLIQIIKEVWHERSSAGTAAPKPLGDEMEFFRQYNEILFHKLEKKLLDLETANQKLRCLEEQYRLSFENVTDIVWTIDAGLYVRKMSPSVARMLGYEARDFIGRPVSDLVKIVAQESMERAMAEMSLVLSGQTIPTSVYPLIAKDGTVKYGEVSGSPILNEGKIVGMVSVIRDITKRKLAEEKLWESEENYRRSLDESPLGIRLISYEGHPIYANRKALDIFGFDSLEEMQNSPIEKRYTPESYAVVLANLEKRRQGVIDTSEYELDIVRTDGEVRRIQSWIKKIIWFGESRYQLIVRDITDEKRAEEKLRESETIYRTLFEKTSNPILMIDSDGNYIGANDAALQFLECTNEQLLLKNVRDTLPPGEKGNELFNKIRILWETGGRMEREYAVNGQAKVLDLTITPCLWQGKRAVFGLGTDITDRKRAEEALRASEENFRHSLDESPLGIRIIADDGRLIYANRAILDIFGFDSIEELIKVPIEWRCTEQSYAELERHRQKRRLGEVDSTEYELDIIRKDGAVRCVQSFFKKIDWFGETHYQLISRDITARKQAEEMLSETTERLRRSLAGTVQAISMAVETRDPYTSGHQKRSAELAKSIATEMGLPADQQDFVGMVASIHDIGKIAIPAEILSRPTKLTNLEFGLIKIHPQVGYDILKDIEFSWPVAKVVLQHHEKLDGTGYPSGLKGDDILLEARILTVADVVEAISSHRPYRPALGIEAALEEISKNRGTQYDPRVVDACLKLFREKGFCIH